MNKYEKVDKNLVSESRGIPKVRTWIVKFWKDGKVFHTEAVDTINKRFAYWEANEKSGYLSYKADKVTIALKHVQESTIQERLVKIGNKYRVSSGSGLMSGKVGTVIDYRKSNIKPRSLEGEYKELDPSKEALLVTDDGRYFRMFKNRLVPIQEKAVSKAQQGFMGMVYAVKKGAKAPSKEVAKAAKSMTTKDAKDFASTKQKGLPEKKSKKVKESIMNRQKKLIVEFIDNICNKEYAPARQKLAAIVNEKMKERIRIAAGSETLEEKQTASKKRSSLTKRARKGEDIGKKGKNFAKVASKAAKRYGSKESGEKVAAAAMWKNAGLKKRG